MTFDEARRKHPTLGMAIYGMDPSEPVTLEIFTPAGEVFSFRGKTSQASLDLAFPPEPEKPPENVFD